MINHVRTFLLNESNAAAGADTGLEYAEIIDPAFEPFIAPAGLVSVQNSVLPAGISVADKLEYIAGVIRLIHQGALDSYITYFDNRITYDYTVSSNMVAIDFDAVKFVNRLDALSNNSITMHALFSNRLNISFLSELYKFWSSGISKSQQVIAILLAYVYKCTEAHK